MACEGWSEKLDMYLDGELAPSEIGSLHAHLRTCADCAVSALARVRLKRSIAAAGKRYEASSELRARTTKLVSNRSRPQAAGFWRVLFIPAALVLILVLGVRFFGQLENARRARVFSELADLHVAALASSSPVDVVSSDRHTVKPWFQGKIPFSFNLPELQGTEFALVGGRVAYLEQAPGAQLIYQLRKHEISVFIFQDRGAEIANLPGGTKQALSYTIDNWTEEGLHYFVVGDVSRAEVERLSQLLRDAR